MKERFINWLIKIIKVDTNKISDGYHTFEELYEHRIVLFWNFLNQKDNDPRPQERPWKSKLHSDGTMYGGWFIAGIRRKNGEQITYHMPIKYWENFNFKVVKKAPKWDGHSPKDVLTRIKMYD